jgi:hypothetical protein
MYEKTHAKFRPNPTTLGCLFVINDPRTSRQSPSQETGLFGLEKQKMLLEAHFYMYEKTHAKFRPNPRFLGMVSKIMIIQKINVCSCHLGEL